MKFEKFWPLVDDDHAKKCLFTDAEGAPDAVFLAVHQPMHLMKKKYQSDEEAVSQTEIEVFEEFLKSDPDSGRVIMPIVGGSAVGKSHMIRWIDAHLRLNPHVKNWHIVRIPKSSSMRGVLDLLLEDLKGPSYDQLKKNLSEVRLPDSPDQARLDLRGSLTGALERLVDDLNVRRSNGDLAQENIRQLSHSGGLINLLNDPGVEEHFVNRQRSDNDRLGALTRIVSPLLKSSHDVDKERENQFYIEDFDFVKNVEVADLAARTRPYFVRLTRSGEIANAVKTLNERLDEALQGLIEFSGASLPDIFKQVRKALLAEGKELILLIEDFAILGGIQQQLLDAVTDPADYRGKQIYCVMRTAMAVTEGRLDEATVLTRAGASWNIESQPFGNEQEAITAFSNMVGGYLNAARHGVTELNRQFAASAGEGWAFSNYFSDHGGELTEEERQSLNAFGFSPRENYPLFPFNRNAIRQIMESNLKVGGKFQFKPRALNKVIRRTIVDFREIWLKGRFPTPKYEDVNRSKKLGNDVNLYLNQTSEPDRMRALLGYWGNRPQSLSEAASLSNEVYKAFSIPPIDWGDVAIVDPAPGTPDIEIGGGVITPPPIGSITPARWKECLDTWRDDHSIPQAEAALLRKWIAEAIRAWIDTDSLTLRDIGYDIKTLIYLPHAKRSQPDVKKFHLVAATEAQLNDPNTGPRFFLTMESVIRFHERQNWDYEGSEIDCARYANFIESLAGEVATHLLQAGPRILPNTSISPLVHSLMMGARILNLGKSSSSTFEDMIEALFDVGPPPNQTPRGQTTKWEDLKHAATQSRAEMRQLLLDHVAARQGGAAKEHAVDASALIPALKDLKKQDWKINEAADLSWRDSLTHSREHIQALKSRLPSILDEEKRTAQEWVKRIESALTETFSMDNIAETMRTTIKQALDCGAFRHRNSNDPKTLRDLINTVRPMKVKGCFDQARLAVEDDQEFGRKLSAIAKLENSVIIKSQELIDEFERFLKETGEISGAKLVDAPDPDKASALLVDQLEKLESNWKQISEKINS